MTETKHTPGPWMVVAGKLPDSGRDMFRVRADDGSAEPVIAVCFPSSDGEIYEEDAAANARLIATAPDLRAACEAVLSEFPAFDSARIERVKHICRAALAKLEG